MKRIILFLALVIFSVSGKAQGITASNGTVVVKQGTVSILGGITGTFVSSGTGTTVISGTPTVSVNNFPATYSINNPGFTNTVTSMPTVNVGTIVPVAISGATISTAANQVIQQTYLKYSVDKSDSIIAQLIRSNLLLTRSVNKQDSIINALAGTNSTTLATNPSSVTTSGTVTAGARFIILETSSDFVGTINTLVFQANGFLSYPICPDTRYPAIPYTVTAGTLFIRKFN